MEHHEPHHGHKVNWGKIVAGAAVVAGAVLLGVNIGGIPEAIYNLFSSTGSGTFDKVLTAIGNIVSNPLTQKVAGAALAGGGAAYFLTHDGSAEARAEHDYHLAHENRESFAMKEEYRLAQSKMLIQAAAAGNPQAQAMLAQQARG